MNTIFTSSFSNTNLKIPSSRYKKSREKSKSNVFSIHRSMNETSYLMRLAQARTPSQVAAVVALARSDAKAVKQVSTSSSDIAKAKKIAKSIEKQGIIKSARLRNENQLEKEAKTELAADKVRRAKKTTEKLAKKRRARKATERVAVANSIPVENHHRQHIDEYVGDDSFSPSPDNIDFRPENTVRNMISNNSAEAGASSYTGSAAATVEGSVDCLI